MGAVRTVPLVVDDAWATDVRASLDGLLKRAFGRKRSITWSEATPEEAAQAGLYFAVTGAQVLAPLREALGVVRREVVWESGVRLVHPLDAPTELEGEQARAFLARLEKESPAVVRTIRFGTRARVEGHLRSRNLNEPAVVESALSLAPLSLAAFASMLLPALEDALGRGERRALLLHDETLWGGLESSVEFHAFQILPNTLGEKALTAWALDRIRATEGEAVAREILEEADATGAIFLDFATVDEALPALVRGEVEARTLLSTAEAALTLEPVVAHANEEQGVARCLDSSGERLGIEVRGVEGLEQGLRFVLEHLGLVEEAARLQARTPSGETRSA